MAMDKLRLSKLKRKSRSLAAGSLTAALAVAAAACAGGGSGSGGGNALTITTWVNPPAVKVLNQIDSEFEKANPGIKVSLK
ncbi:MAG: ABC transporter substrate-binding protein, partial [Actinobacteria bacterium]|nr:ABC transporter substrate-binding protein [Actinomycetota bacterium]